MPIQESLRQLRADDHISEAEYSAAKRADAAGVDEHTIGYELEVLKSAQADLPKPNLHDLRHDSYGYAVEDEEDALYELISPPAQHPLPLIIATRGLARAGWLPHRTTGRVTAHVSIGTSENLETLQDQRTRVITMLRGIDLLGHTTTSRLLSPIRRSQGYNGKTAQEGWNYRGDAGVYYPEEDNWPKDNWQGDNTRIELRTLGYYSPDQFGAALDAAYHLSRGLLSPEGSVAARIYNTFEAWLQDYFEANRLPNADSVLAYQDVPQRVLEAYLRPYANYLAGSSRTELNARTDEAISNLKEEFRTNIGETADPATLELAS